MIVTEDTSSFLSTSKRFLSGKKRNGIFYTPNQAAELLVSWGIRSVNDTVLEPSFGGCGFLEAAVNRLKHLGSLQPEAQLFGCDVDPVAFGFLNNLFQNDYNYHHFKKQDFLTILPTDFQADSIDVIIGNPPYVSWHNMLSDQRNSASVVTTPAGVALNRKGSLWTFFVAHSLRFLNYGGRMAWILPGSFMYADYAKPLRDTISTQFSRTIAILLEKRIFLDAGTEESSVVLLCEGYQKSTGQPMHFTSAKGLPELQDILLRWGEDEVIGIEWNQGASRLLAPSTVIELYDRVLRTPSSTSLSYLIKTRIGLVTGDNHFFVLSPSKVKEIGLPRKAIMTIVARQEHFRGLKVSKDDLNDLEKKGKRCMLLNTEPFLKERHPKALAEYLKSYKSDEINENRTFAKRPIWHRIHLEDMPDAFFSCMNWYGPTLALNSAQTTCTNSVYRVNFENNLFTTPNARQLIAISLQSGAATFDWTLS